jgi:hypothetical protein
MKNSHRAADTSAPKASQDHSGWRRRGEYSNSSETDPIANASPTGQRAMAQSVSISLLQPTESRIAEPPTSSTTDSSRSIPAESASRSATTYLRRKGRSRSTP